MITADLLRQLLDYDPEIGALTWRVRSIEMFSTAKHPKRTCSTWNTKYAGKAALTSIDGGGYMHGTILGKTYYAHRVIWMMQTGEWPTSLIDHDDTCRTNNKWSNLKDVTTLYNSQNRGMCSRNTSGVTGVDYDKRRGVWVATINVDGARVRLGRFVNISDAAQARKSAEQQYGFHPDHGKVRA